MDQRRKCSFLKFFIFDSKYNTSKWILLPRSCWNFWSFRKVYTSQRNVGLLQLLKQHFIMPATLTNPSISHGQNKYQFSGVNNIATLWRLRSSHIKLSFDFKAKIISAFPPHPIPQVRIATSLKTSLRISQN